MLVVATTERLGDSNVPCLRVHHATGSRAKPLLGELAFADPVCVELLAARLVGAFIGVSTEVVALSLQQIGW